MRLIDADKHEKTLLNLANKYKRKRLRTALMLWTALDMLSCAETIDAEPVRYGKWRLIHDSYDRVKEYNCSNCDTNAVQRHRYCPNCGAKMDGGN